MTMYPNWDKASAEMRLEGRLEAQANGVLTVLRARGIAVPAAARKRILAEKNLARLQRWLEKAVVATSIGGVIALPRRARPPGRPGGSARPRTPARSSVQSAR